VDELSTVAEWDAIKMCMPKSKKGSRIVVVTQQLGLAISCTGYPYQVSILRQLTDGQSLCAFFNKVSGFFSTSS
jgi:predicted aconitase